METTNDNLIDKQLYISMQQGNKKAFDTLFIKYYAMLCAFARSFVSLEDAEEVVQDTMLQIWENRKTNHIDSSVHHYLFKAVKNKCYTLMTRNSLRFHFVYLQLIIPQYFISNKSGIWSLSLIVHSKG